MNIKQADTLISLYEKMLLEVNSNIAGGKIDKKELESGLKELKELRKELSKYEEKG